MQFILRDQDLAHHMLVDSSERDSGALRWYGNADTGTIALGTESECRRMLDVPVWVDLVPLVYDYTQNSPL